jgi:hypothetical protein
MKGRDRRKRAKEKQERLAMLRGQRKKKEE